MRSIKILSEDTWSPSQDRVSTFKIWPTVVATTLQCLCGQREREAKKYWNVRFDDFISITEFG
jgi:hypothetical protein